MINQSLGVIPYKNLKHDKNLKTVYEFYKPYIEHYLFKFNREIYENNYDEAESCKFKFKYIATIDGKRKILVFCEDTFKVTWKVILETCDIEKNETCFEEREIYILDELSKEGYFNYITGMFKNFLMKDGENNE